jgi:hypothetical protein
MGPTIVFTLDGTSLTYASKNTSQLSLHNPI